MGGTAVAPQVVQLFTRRGNMRGPRYWWLAALVLIVMAGVVLAGRALFPPAQVATGGPAWSSSPAVAAAARRETRPTLDPALFVGTARLAPPNAPEVPGPP